VETGRKIENNMENLEATKAFVERNKVESNNYGCECVDGRYTADQSEGRIRMFGGDLGVLLAIRGSLTEKGEDFSTKGLIERYVDVIKEERGEDAKLLIHTDEHNPIGCGHANHIAKGEHEESYEVRPDDAKELWEELKNYDHSECKILPGDHKEKGVLLVYGNKFSVNSSDESEMYFVVDVDRTNDWLTKVAEKMEIDDITPQNLQDVYWKQAACSSSILAAEKPQYKVEFDDEGNSSVSFVNYVPKLSQ
jgi:hypothetical protein